MLITKNGNYQLLEQYLAYFTVIKGRSENTVNEYRNDLLMFFRFVKDYRQQNNSNLNPPNCADFDIEFIKSVSIHEMYSYISHCQKQGKLSASTRARRIVSIRQFWKYLKTKAHLIDNNIAEELETPKIPKRIPKYLSLEDSMRLLIKSEDSIGNHCILTMFLNCALRLSELTSMEISHIQGEAFSIIGKAIRNVRYFLLQQPRKHSQIGSKSVKHTPPSVTLYLLLNREH